MKRSFVIGLALAGLLMTPAARAQTETTGLRLLTTEPEDDFAPVASPDGNWLVYVSRRASDTELHRIALSDTGVNAPEVMQPSPADDDQPAFSMDGKWLAWVSTREDAFGDIHVVRFPGGGGGAHIPRRGYRDMSPRFDGDNLIFEGEDEAGAMHLWSVPAGKWNAAPQDQGLIPSFTLPPLPFGAAPSGSPTASRSLYSVFADDTNGDGTIGDGDDPSVWQWLDEGKQWRQLTGPMSGLNSPLWIRDRLGFSARVRGNLDITMLEERPALSAFDTAQEALADARAFYDENPLLPFDAVARCRQAWLLEPGSPASGTAILLMMDILREAGRPTQALQAAAQWRTATGSASIALKWREVVLRFDEQRRAFMSPDSIRTIAESALEELKALAGEAHADEESRAAIQLETAEVYRFLKMSNEAVEEAQRVEQNPGASTRQRVAAMLARANVYDSLGLSGEATNLRVKVLTEHADEHVLAEQAALKLADLSMQGATTLDERILALRNLAAAHSELAPLRQATRLREGELFTAESRVNEAQESLKAGLDAPGASTRLGARVAFALAESYARDSKFKEAIDTYRSVESRLRAQFFPGAPAFYEEARRGLIREYLNKGDYESRVGDAPLALVTFQELIDREPRLVEAWRGLIDAQSRVNILGDKQINAYRDEAKKNPEDSLAWYKAGLALTYKSPIPKSAFAALEKAIGLDGAVPYYHQTLGFALEMRGRQDTNREDFVHAFDEYQRALALLDAAERPEGYARLLINTGNTASLLGNYARAAGIYQRRLDQGIAFDDLRTEFLFHRSHGIALFRSNRPSAAVDAFRRAESTIAALVNLGLMKSEEARERETELMDREALALMEAGNLTAAADQFAAVASRQPENSLNRVRAWRNRAVSLHRAAMQTSGVPRDQLLASAGQSVATALELATVRNLTEVKEDGGGSLFSMQKTMTASGGVGAQLELSRAEEERLLHALQARIRLERGEREAALADLRAQLAAEPKLTDGNRAYFTTARLVTLETLAREQERMGQRSEAADTLVEAIDAARFEIADEPVINGGGLSVVLSRLTEMTLASSEPPFADAALRATWIGKDFSELGGEELLDACLAKALTLANPDDGELLVNAPLHRARLLLSRSLLAEQLAMVGADGIDAVRAAANADRAMQLAHAVEREAQASPEGGDIKRLVVLARAVRVRTLLRVGDAAAAASDMEQAVSFARAAGYPHLAWWLRAQGTLQSDTAVAAAASRSALAELQKLVPGELLSVEDVPFDLMAHCERTAIDDAVARESWEEAWELSEQWRAARLRILFNSANPRVPTGPSEEGDWLREALRRRAAVASAIERVRATPLSSDATASTNALSRAEDDMRAHLAAGLDASRQSAILLAPRASTIADASILLEGGLPLPEPAALVLNTTAGSCAWTIDGQHELKTAEDWAALREAAGVWFVQGSAPDAALAGDTTIVQLLTFESTFLVMQDARFAMDPEPTMWPGEAADPAKALAALGDAMSSTTHFVIDVPVRPVSADPLAWRIGALPIAVGEVVERESNLTQIAAGLDSENTWTPARSSGLEEGLASVLAYTNAGEPSVNGHRFVGAAFPAKELSEAAEAEITGSTWQVVDYSEKGQTERALPPARRILQLRAALEKPTGEVAEAATLLAQIQSDLKQFSEASKTLRRLVEVRRSEGDPIALAEALSRFATSAVDAREFSDAHTALLEAASLYEKAGDPQKHLEKIAGAGVALENAGDYEGAQALYAQARELAAGLGDHERIAQQWRRSGRIYFLLQSRYEPARDAFTKALDEAQQAGNTELALLCELDLARVEERISRYNDAVERAKSVEDRARDAGLSVLEADAVLLHAFIEWARADYFAAFQAQRHGLELADGIPDPLLVAIAHNTAGLISWALNDTDAAMDEFNVALSIAERERFPGEIATYHNNRGLVYRSLAQFAEALDEFNAALATDEQFGNKWGIAHASRNIGMTYLQSEAPHKALEPLERAAALAREIGDETNLAKSLVALGDANREIGSNALAQSSYSSALELARDIPVPEMEWRALYGQARMKRSEGDRAAAIELLTSAVEVVENLRARIKIEEFQDGFLLDKQELYDDLVELLLDEGRAGEAFEMSERSRARNFIDLLGNQKVDFATAGDNEAMAKEAEHRATIEELERRVHGGDATAQEQLDQARRAYSQFVIELRAANPQLSSFVKVEALQLSGLQALLEDDTRVVVYHVLKDEIAAWVISPTGLQVVRTPVDRPELSRRIGALRARMQNFDELDTELAIVSQWVAQPVYALLGDAKRVCVVPHRELHQLPFACLQMNGRAWIDWFALYHAPSAGVLQYTIARRGTVANADRVLAVGNPDLGNAALNLPFAQKEAERLSLVFPQTDIVTGGKATESWITDNIGDYGIVHIATHGEFDPSMPLLSAIRLTADQESDGQLTAGEIFSLSLRADLVALSACQTGLGRLSNGDDVIGLNRAFVYAGTRQILSSLWRVDDVSTSVLIKHFYRNMKETDRADALREAMQQVRARYPHPAHWSGLVLTGDWQ